MRSYRILIVGGGPTGLVSALELAESGHHVTLIEAQAWPRDKVCGEGLMPLALEMLDHHKVAYQSVHENMSFFDGIRYIDQDLEAKGHFHKESGVGIRRIELSRLLYEQVLAKENIELHEHTRVKQLVQNKETVSAECVSKTLTHWSGDYIVGADGVHSKVRKLLGIESVPLSSTQRLGARLHLQVNNHGISEVQVYWSVGVEAYLTPCGTHQIEIAFMWERSLYQGSVHHLEDYLWSLFPVLRQRYGDSRRLSEFSQQGGFATRSSSLVLGRGVLVGDAAYFFDGITGKGLALGFQMARWLRLGLERGNLDHYERHAQRSIRYNIYLTRVVLSLSRSYRWRQLIIRLLRLGPFSTLVQLTGQGKLDGTQKKKGRWNLTFQRRVNWP